MLFYKYTKIKTYYYIANQNVNIVWNAHNQGDLLKSYKIFDHLGTLHVEGIGVGNDLQSYYD
jgi:hypothetical protein